MKRAPVDLVLLVLVPLNSWNGKGAGKNGVRGLRLPKSILIKFIFLFTCIENKNIETTNHTWAVNTCTSGLVCKSQS